MVPALHRSDVGKIAVKALLFSLVCFIVLATIFGAMALPWVSVSTGTNVYFTIAGKNYYLIPLVTTTQNLVKADTQPIDVDITRQNLDIITDSHLFENASVRGNMTDPLGAISYFNFTNLGTGTYEYNFTYAYIGTYRLEITSTHNESGYSLARAYIYVGKMPINIIITGTEYTPGQKGTIWFFAEDGQGNPISGGYGAVKIIKNDSVWVNANITESIAAVGAYYYEFTAPAEDWNYLVCVNFTSGLNNDYSCSDTFHILANVSGGGGGGGGGLTAEQNATLYQILNVTTLTYDLVANHLQGQIANLTITVNNIDANMVSESDLNNILSQLDKMYDYTKKMKSWIADKWGNQSADNLAQLIVDSKWNIAFIKNSLEMATPVQIQNSLDAVSENMVTMQNFITKKEPTFMEQYGIYIGGGIVALIVIFIIVMGLKGLIAKEEAEVWEEEYNMGEMPK